MYKLIGAVQHMGHKKKIKLIVALLSPVAIIPIGLAFWQLSGLFETQLYEFTDVIGYRFTEFIIVPLFFASTALSISLLILYFLPEFVYTMWWKYARVYIPVSLLLFMLLVADGGGFGVPSLTPPDGFSMFLSALYLFGFVFFVLVAYARRHK